MRHYTQHLVSKLNNLVPRLWSRLPITPDMRNGLVWLLSPKFSIGVVGVVINDRREVLLLKHTYRGARAWGLLGGGLKPGESLQACLRREMQEETGLRIMVDRHLVTTALRTRKVVEVAYICRLLPGQTLERFKPSAEVEEVRFFTLATLPSELYAKHKRLIGAVLEREA